MLFPTPPFSSDWRKKIALLQEQFDLSVESYALAFISSFQDLNDPFYGEKTHPCTWYEHCMY